MAVTNQLDIEIKSQSDKATKSLDGLISKLNEVNSALNGLNVNNIQNIANSLKGLKGVKVNIGGSSNAIGSANNQFTRADSLIKTLTQTANKANTGFLNLNKTVFKMAATWGMFYASAYPFIRMLNAAWQSSQSAMDYVETYNYYSVTMDKIFGQVGEDAADSFQNSYVASLKSISEKMTGFSIGINGELFENYSKNLGADPEALMNYQARIGAVTNAVGLMAQQSVDAQKALSMLSQDLSSLTNTPLESVMTNLSSGLIGQSRALYKYGIDITNATLKEYALANGITKSVSAMSQAEKMQLRLVAILDQSKVAWGDMANTVNSVSNQYRIFTQNVSNMSRVLGNLFLPIVSKVLPYVNALMIALRQMFTLLGFKLYGDNWLSQTLDGISSGYAGDDVVDGLEDIEDAADDASGSAKKLKKALMGFDELNIIDPNSSSGSGSGSGGAGIDLTDAIEAALGDYEDIWNKAFADAENKAVTMANRLMSFIKNGNFEGLGKWISDNLASELNNIDWDRIYSGARQFGKGLAQFLNGLVQPSTFYAVGKTIANSLNTAIYASLEFGKEFDFKKLGVAIGSYWNGIFDNFDFAAFGETVGVWVGGIVATIGNAIKTIKWDTLFDGIKEGINGFFKGIGESDMTISDLAIVIGLVTIKKILKLSWGAMVGKAISQSLAKVIASKLGTEIAADAGISTALASGLATQFANVKSKLSFAITDFINPLNNASLRESLTPYFSSIAVNIAGIGSIIGGLTLSLHEFFDMWENGFDGISMALESAGIALAAFGAVLLGVSAPVAIAVAAIAGLGSAALILAHDQLPSVGDAIKAAITVPGGVQLSEITQQASEHILAIGDSFIELGNKVEANERIKTSIHDTADSILEIQRNMDLGVTSVDEGVTEISTLFETLQNNTQTYYNNIANTILGVYGEGGVLEGAVANFEDVAQNTVLLGKQLTEEQQAYYEQYQAMEDKTSTEALELLRKATGTKDEVTQAMEDAKNNINAIIGQIDWSKFFDKNGNLIDEEGFKAELAQVTDVIAQSQADVETSITSLNSTLYATIQTALDKGNTELAASYQVLIDINNKSIDDFKAQIANYGIDVTDAIQQDLVGKITGVIGNAVTDYNNQGFGGQLAQSIFSFGSVDSADAYALEAATQYTDAIGTVSGIIEEQMAQLGIDGAGWGEQASNDIINSIFTIDSTTATNGMTNVTTQLDANYQEAIDNVDFQKYGVQSTEGFFNGVVSSLENGRKAMDEMSRTISTAFHDGELQFGSPSKKFGQYAQWTIEGYNNNISTYMATTEPYMQAWAQSILTSFNTAFTDGLTGIQDIFNGLVPYFEDDVFALLNSALENEVGTVQETITTNYEDFKAQTDEMLLGIEDSFSLATASINEMFTTMWTTIKSTSVTGANAMASVMQNALNNMASGMNSFLADTENALRRVAEESGTNFGGLPRVGTVTIPRLNINAYRVGGFPEDGLFYANHTELVGQFTNGRTAVANNEQIVEGIRSGVASAVREELGYYLQDIADNTSATASNTEDIKNQPSNTMSNRDIARANRIGSRSMGLTLRTT